MDAQLLSRSYETHRAEIARFARSLTRDPETAQDIVQEAFLRLACQLDEGEPPKNIRAWLYQVARNLHVSSCRHQTVANRHAQRSLPASEPQTSSAEDEALRAELDDELRRALARLEPIDRRSVVMAAYGYSGNEIAHAIERTGGSVRVRLCRVRSRLRSELGASA